MKGWIAGVAFIALSPVGMASVGGEVFGSDAGVRVVQDTAAGRQLFVGKGNCHVCHGANAKGTPLAPDLTDAEWINIDAKQVTQANIVALVKTGVPQPKKHPAPMPANGGATLTDAEVQSVAAYVLSLSKKP